MKTASQKIHASTQKFTEILDISDNIVVLDSNNACTVIEVTASNFALLSKKEQDAKIYAYAALLNSLTFPIQIVVRNRRVDVTSYLKSLEEQEKDTKNPLLAQHIMLYRNFVKEMVRVNVVLNKTFYVVISYNALEAGVSGASQALGKHGKVNDEFIISAKKILQSKSDSVMQQLKKLAVNAKTLDKKELVKLFYDTYNEDTLEASQVEDDIKNVIIHQKQ